MDQSKLDHWRKGKLPQRYELKQTKENWWRILYQGMPLLNLSGQEHSLEYESQEAAFDAAWADFKAKLIPGTLVVSMSRMCNSLQPWIHPVYDGVIETPETDPEKWNKRNSEAEYCEWYQLTKVRWDFPAGQMTDLEYMEHLMIITPDIRDMSWREKIWLFIGPEAQANFDRAMMLGKHRQDSLSTCLLKGIERIQDQLDAYPIPLRPHLAEYKKDLMVSLRERKWMGEATQTNILLIVLAGAGWDANEATRPNFPMQEYFPELFKYPKYPYEGFNISPKPMSMAEVMDEMWGSGLHMIYEVADYLKEIGH